MRTGWQGSVLGEVVGEVLGHGPARNGVRGGRDFCSALRSRRPSTSRYSTGTRTRVSAVEEIRPPITTMASGWEMKPPPPVRPSAIGVRAKTVASAVMRMGRRRWRAPCVIASATFIPGSPFAAGGTG